MTTYGENTPTAATNRARFTKRTALFTNNTEKHNHGNKHSS